MLIIIVINQSNNCHKLPGLLELTSPNGSNRLLSIAQIVCVFRVIDWNINNNCSINNDTFKSQVIIINNLFRFRWYLQSLLIYRDRNSHF